jgi:hypothetical protein
MSQQLGSSFAIHGRGLRTLGGCSGRLMITQDRLTSESPSDINDSRQCVDPEVHQKLVDRIAVARSSGG